ncbi:MAG: hypothetical protein ACXWCW_26800 [Burkholderiales bacterium]
MAEVVPLRPNPAEPQTRRRASIRGKYPPSPVLGFGPQIIVERRKKKYAGFDIAGALEANLDRYGTKDAQLTLIKRWLDAAKQEGLAARHAEYVRALERALVVMSKAPSAQHAIETLQGR